MRHSEKQIAGSEGLVKCGHGSNPSLIISCGTTANISGSGYRDLAL